MSRPRNLPQSLPSLWRILSCFRPYVRKQRRLVAGSVAMLVAGVGFRLLEPWPLKFVFDRVLFTSSRKGTGSVPFLEGLDPIALLTIAAIAVVLIATLRALADYAYAIGFALVSNRVLGEVRNEVYQQLQRLSLSFHTRARGGDLLVRVTGDIGMLKDGAVTAFIPLFANLLVLLGMVGMMLWLQWRLALLILVTVPIYWLSTVRIGRRLRTVSREQRQREGAMAAKASESIGAIKVVQALSLEGMFARDFATENNRSLSEGVKAARLTARLERTVDVLIALATGLILWYGTCLVLRQELTPGELLVFLAYLKTAFRPVRDLAKYTARLTRAAAAGERVLDVLERTPDVHDLPGAVPAPPFLGEVRFQDVGFAYEPDRNVLEHIDFEVCPGQCAALVGPSGIGKSTVLSLIPRLYDPVKGSLLIDGQDIREYTLASLRSQINVVLQDSILFAASVWDNIACASPGATHEEIEAAARLANAHEFIRELPQGYDTILGERGVTLSHGQRQRIAIARAAVRKAPVLILDEPTTGLDEENERAVMEALERLAEGRTTFLVTHELSLAARADLILYLEGGRVLERGTHAALMQAGGRYATLYRMQLAAGNHASQDQGSPASPWKELTPAAGAPDQGNSP